ncbi:hypothetical protein MBLNU457_3498t1 [Dothideomycetes sp. NU457]
MSGITLYFLQASRSIRTAWQLEELGLDYNVEFSPRVNKVAPPDFKQKAGDLGKFPTLVDNGLSVFESGAICEYLEEKYDQSHKLLPTDPSKRSTALRWVHAAEGTFMLHAIGITYTRWFSGEHVEAAAMIEAGMGKNVQKDFDLLEQELGKSQGKFLLGEQLTVADIMMHFSASFILARGLGTRGKSYPGVERWIEDCEATESFRKAVRHTGYDLSQSG